MEKDDSRESVFWTYNLEVPVWMEINDYLNVTINVNLIWMEKGIK